MTDFTAAQFKAVTAALDQAQAYGLIISWREVPGRGIVVIAGDMAEHELLSDRDADLFCGALGGAVCALRDGKARADG